MDRPKFLRDTATIVALLVVGAAVFYLIPDSGDTAAVLREVDQLANTNTMQKQNNAGTQTAQMHIQIEKEGAGPGAQKGQVVEVDYTGTLSDGTIFDSSVPRGETFKFTLGAGQVISGWDLGVFGMKVGERRKLIIPPELAYGTDGISGVIPQNATLTFVIELRAIK